jgi:hypothetical protein
MLSYSWSIFLDVLFGASHVLVMELSKGRIEREDDYQSKISYATALSFINAQRCHLSASHNYTASCAELLRPPTLTVTVMANATLLPLPLPLQMANPYSQMLAQSASHRLVVAFHSRAAYSLSVLETLDHVPGSQSILVQVVQSLYSVGSVGKVEGRIGVEVDIAIVSLGVEERS